MKKDTHKTALFQFENLKFEKKHFLLLFFFTELAPPFPPLAWSVSSTFCSRKYYTFFYGRHQSGVVRTTGYY